MDCEQSKPSNRPAIVVMCAGVLLLVANDAIAKQLVARFDPFQILFVRSVIALPFVATVLLWTEGAAGLRSGRAQVHALRALLAVVATYLFIRSLGVLPLAEATSIIFAAPIFVAALSMPLLRQRVSGPRIVAVGTGFFGALIVLRPGAETMHAASLLVIGAAFVNALVMLSARWIDKRDGFWTMTLFMTLFSGLFCAFVLATEWPVVNAKDAALFIAMAAAGTLGIALITQAFRMGEAAAVAPFDYSALIWASALGWAVWGNVPDWPVYLGAVIIATSGLYLILLDASGER